MVEHGETEAWYDTAGLRRSSVSYARTLFQRLVLYGKTVKVKPRERFKRIVTVPVPHSPTCRAFPHKSTSAYAFLGGPRRGLDPAGTVRGWRDIREATSTRAIN